MELELFKALSGGLGLAGRLSKAVKKVEEPVSLVATGLYHRPGLANSLLAPRLGWFDSYLSSRLNVNVLKGLTMSGGEKDFVQGLSHLLAGRPTSASESLAEAARRGDSKGTLTDAHWALGGLLLQQAQSGEAVRHFKAALMAQQGLGRALKRWCPSFHLGLALTDYSLLVLGPDLVGLTVALALSQFHADPGEALRTLDQLLELLPGEPTALFFAALLRFRVGLDAEVFQLLQRCLPDSTIQVASLLLLALACARLGDGLTGRELLRRLAGRSDLEGTLANDLRAALALCSAWAGDLKESEAEWDALRRQSPNYCSFQKRWGLPLTSEAGKPSELPPEPEIVVEQEKPPLKVVTPDPPKDPVKLSDDVGGVSHLVCQEKQWEIPLNRGAIVLGREGDVVLEGDTAASKQHACISFVDGDYWVEDLGSTNGTWVNRHRIRRVVELHRGDVLEIGQHRFEVR